MIAGKRDPNVGRSGLRVVDQIFTLMKALQIVVHGMSYRCQNFYFEGQPYLILRCSISAFCYTVKVRLGIQFSGRSSIRLKFIL